MTTLKSIRWGFTMKLLQVAAFAAIVVSGSALAGS
ncbi:TPA: curlin, partial [Citrobacter amalonaticus]|nr:curlin [Citrobacter amalonaticus]